MIYSFFGRVSELFARDAIFLSSENILLVGSLLLLGSIYAGKTFYKYGVPTLLIFLGFGMLAGSEGLFKVHFNNPQTAQFIGVIALNFILFSGGLSTNWKSVKPVLKEGVFMSTFGVLLTALFLGLIVHLITDFSLIESFLLSSIVSSTDAAAVFSLLRSRSIALKPNLRPTLELESGSNDPMAYVLTISFLSLLTAQDMGLWKMLFLFLTQMSLGVLLGFGFAWLSKYIINKIELNSRGLYPVFVVALMYLTFSGTEFLGGNGFLAIYISGVYLGNQPLTHKETILGFFDGSAWLMQLVLFLTLGLLVFPSELIQYWGLGLIISLALILIVRPLAVLIALLPFKMHFYRKLYFSWVGLRGAVPIVFATYPLIAGIDKANMIFNIVFFIAVSSLILQGTTLGVVAKWLKLTIREKIITEHDLLRADILNQYRVQYLIEADSPLIGKNIIALKFPSTVNVSFIQRGDQYLLPDGKTKLVEKDILTVFARDEEALAEAQACVVKRGVQEIKENP